MRLTHLILRLRLTRWARAKEREPTIEIWPRHVKFLVDRIRLFIGSTFHPSFCRKDNQCWKKTEKLPLLYKNCGHFRKEIKDGGEVLKEKIKQYKPKIAVFNGKGIYEVFCGHKNFSFGKQPDPIPGTSTVRARFSRFLGRAVSSGVAEVGHVEIVGCGRCWDKPLPNWEKFDFCIWCNKM